MPLASLVLNLFNLSWGRDSLASNAPKKMKITFRPAKLGFRGSALIALGWLFFSTAPTKAQSYSLGTTALWVGSAAGSGSVTLAVNPTNANWTATTNAAWLHLSAGFYSGTGSTNLVFSYDANSGATRLGSLTIAGQTLNVTQAGSGYVAAGSLTTLVSTNLDEPAAVAVDALGNVYIADTYNNAIKKWLVASNTVITLVSNGLNDPKCLAVDASGNVIFPGNNEIEVWVAEFSGVLTLVSSNYLTASGVAVDEADNIYFCNDQTVQEWVAATQTVTTRSLQVTYPSSVAVDAVGNVYVSSSEAYDGIYKLTVANSNLSSVIPPGTEVEGMTLDGSGNIYFVGLSDNLEKWTAASNTVTTLVSSGLLNPGGVAVDDLGNLYIADTGSNAIKELPHAFVDPTAKTEGSAAGTDVLPSVLPIKENLSGVFSPTSSQPWLTITGITNGVVSFAFTATVTNRTGDITLLGQIIPVTQMANVPPPHITGAKLLGNGAFQFSFTNINQSATFSVLASTNLLLPLTNWTMIGTASNIGPGLLQFTDTQVTNSQRFYIISAP